MYTLVYKTFCTTYIVLYFMFDVFDKCTLLARIIFDRNVTLIFTLCSFLYAAGIFTILRYLKISLVF